MANRNSKAHADRVKRELREAGVRGFGFWKFAVRYLHNLIHKDEHVKGVVYGRYQEAPGAPAWEEGMLVATDRRIMFVDRKPGYLRADNITYDVVSAVEDSKAGPFSAVTLYTRMGNFTLRFVKRSCAECFVRYVESRRLESLPEPRRA
jgi:hypothetical protein